MGLLVRTAGLALLGGLGFVAIYVLVHIAVIELAWKQVLCRIGRAVRRLGYRMPAISAGRATGRGNRKRVTVRRSEHGAYIPHHLPGGTAPGRGDGPPTSGGGSVAMPVRDPVPVRESQMTVPLPGLSPPVKTGLQIPVRPAQNVADFTCPTCGATSHHPIDAREGYCGACHEFTGPAGKWPKHRLQFWSRELQLKELGGIIVDDSSTAAAVPNIYAEVEKWFQTEASGLSIKPTIALDDMTWVWQEVQAARDEGMVDQLEDFGLIDGGIRIKLADSRTHYIDLIEMPLGSWYMFLTPADQDPPRSADRSWAYGWDSTRERPIHTAIAAAIAWDGDITTDPPNMTRRL